MQPDVEQPVTITVSIRSAISIETRWVWKKADGYFLTSTTSSSSEIGRAHV